MNLQIDITGTNIDISQEQALQASSRKWLDHLRTGKAEYTGWVNLPLQFNSEILYRILDAAKEIRSKCDLLIVVGVGGSYLGAKAVIDALNGSKEDCPEIVFAGFNMSAAYLERIVRRMKKENVCLCVISKSGSTVEPLLSYSILKDKLYGKYGVEAKDRIYVITDAEKGALRKEADENGYTSFVVPDDIGGRYSVLSAVGLLPIAAAGHDILSMLRGAAKVASSPDWHGSLMDYTICRVALQNQGKTLEIFESFEANLRYFGEWLKQLFGESEGKDGKGAYPASLCFSTDLHSIGQFLQQGNQMFYETLIHIQKSNYDFLIPSSAGYPYAGKTLETINECSEKGVIAAHKKGGIPIITIEIPVLNEDTLGQMIYFFEISCAISSYNLGVNPFNQPGVEAYKSEMRKLVEEL